MNPLDSRIIIESGDSDKLPWAVSTPNNSESPDHPFNNDNWGEATNPEINLSCLSDDINIINDTMPIENIPSDEAMVNFEPIIIEFSGNINPGETECLLNFTSNQDSYIKYETSFPVTFNISETQILLGDLNQDTSIDILDVIITVNIIWCSRCLFNKRSKDNIF